MTDSPVLADAGVAIVSGLARGVDAIAHRVALEHGAPTVGVLAGGIDQVYPRENAGLADRILESGCLVSEYPVGIPARRDYFPRRNRIIAGLARGVLVGDSLDYAKLTQFLRTGEPLPVAKAAEGRRRQEHDRHPDPIQLLGDGGTDGQRFDVPFTQGSHPPLLSGFLLP